MALILILIAVGIVGLLLGCRFRIATLVFASTIIACLIVAWGIFEGWSIAKTVMLLFACLTVVSAAYLLGLSLFRVFRSVFAKPDRSS